MAEQALRKVATGVGRTVTKTGVRRCMVAAATETRPTTITDKIVLTPKEYVQPPVLDNHSHHHNFTEVAGQYDNASSKSDISTLKTLQDLPGPQGLPVLGTAYEYFRKGNRGQMHKVQVGLICLLTTYCNCYIYEMVYNFF